MCFHSMVYLSTEKDVEQWNNLPLFHSATLDVEQWNNFFIFVDISGHGAHGYSFMEEDVGR